MSQSGQLQPVDASDAASVHDSSDESSESNEDLYRSTLQARIALWKVQIQLEHLTPRLQKEVESAIGVTTKRMQKPQLSADTGLVERLESLHNDITEHWCKVFKSPEDHSILLVNIRHYEAFLVGMLQVQHHREPKDDSTSDDDEYYQDNILFPLEEMILGSLVSHAENRLCIAAAARQAGTKGTGAYVSRLIQGCDWEGLAKTLIYDRQLFNNLCSHKTMCVNQKWLEARRPEILGRMDDLQRMYYTAVSSPTNYTISKHAMDLSARNSAAGPHHVPLSRISKSQIHTSPISKIKGRLQLLADGLNLRFRQDSATSSAYPQEKSHLLFQSQKSNAASSIVSDEKGSLLNGFKRPWKLDTAR